MAKVLGLPSSPPLLASLASCVFFSSSSDPLATQSEWFFMGKMFSDLFFDLKDTFPRLPPRLELLLQLLLLLLVEDVVLNRIDALPKLDISLRYCCWWWWGLWRWWWWQHAFCYSLPLTQDVWWGLPCTGEGNGCKLYLKNLPKIQFLVRDKKSIL